MVNVEQALTDQLGLFSRISWNAGKTEIIGWTDCNESFSLGAELKGKVWGRPDDKIGVGGVINGLSPEARAYFAAGGLGILIGDGAPPSKEDSLAMTAVRDAVLRRLWPD